jgi:hypothetical protein
MSQRATQRSKTKTPEPISYSSKKKLWRVKIKGRVIGFYRREIAQIVAEAYAS